MNPAESSNVSATFPDTHTIIYNNKPFPFNLEIFNLFTDYFKNNQDQIQPDKTIILVNDEKTEFSENSIQSFINFCQLKNIEITNDNIYSLYYLSKKFNVPKMIEKIKQHAFQKEDLVFQFFLYDQENDLQKKIEYEEKISQNLNHIIDNDSLLSLPIPILHRILSRARNIDQEKIENFLIRKLSKSGREASVLFDVIDMRNASFAFTNKLIDEYSEEDFDFHYINPVYMKSIHDQQNKLISNSEDMKRKQEKTIQKLSEENRQMHKEIESLRNFIKSSLSCTYFPYGGESQAFNGIIGYLTVLCGGNVNDKRVVIVTQSSFYIEGNKDAHNCRYAVDFGVKNESNYLVTGNKPNNWLKYDFVDRKVRPTQYSIRSRPKKTYNNNHPKTWVIEGSNNGNDDDENDWKVLDERKNDENDCKDCLVGLDKKHTFDIRTHLEPNESFRYLRLRLTGHDSSNSFDYLVLSALEYFGYLIHNI